MKTEILLSEFLVNIVKHGLENYKFASDMIALLIKGDEVEIAVTVFDRGKFWESGELESSGDIDQLLSELSRSKAESGRGIPLIRKLSPKISRRHLCGLNETIFTIRRDEEKSGRNET
ncbi:hypothetical protein SDC9_187169 [bioreactor metagenome]|uniref:Histidine kinase/HSP90-like ATPase domain-containing protein n=1 Tax=bioreactor metagenome TaxID=1076179 RepID=A0A645HKW3_9ZZZZ